MTPYLSNQGRIVVLLGALFALLGAFARAPLLIVLGTTVFAFVMGAQLCTSIALRHMRRKSIRLAWSLPKNNGKAFTQGQSFQLNIAIRNRAAHSYRLVSLRVVASPALQFEKADSLNLFRGKEHHLRLSGSASAVGRAHLYGAELLLSDPLHIFEYSVYFPNPIAFKVFPPIHASRSHNLSRRLRVPVQEFASGPQFVISSGLSGELRELREHNHGDSFKRIAWKASAKRRKLMVREIESEIVRTHLLLVDIGFHMRQGPPGQSRLDHAISQCARIARSSLDAGDRVGLICYDTRLFAALPPNTTHRHYLQVLNELVATKEVVDEDLCDATDSEIVAAVANYLENQESCSLRIRHAPQKDSPLWSRIASGPDGALYDLVVMEGSVNTLLAKAKADKKISSTFARNSEHPTIINFRRFCLHAGIELPYLNTPGVGARSEGLAQALAKAASFGKGHQIRIISSLDGTMDQAHRLREPLLKLKHQHHSLEVVVPVDYSFGRRPQTSEGQAVLKILSAEERERLDFAQHFLRSHGVPLQQLHLSDSTHLPARKSA